MKKLGLLFFLLNYFSFSYAQISKSVQLSNWNTAEALNSPITEIDLPVPDLQKLRKADSIEANHKDIAWRFGYAIEQPIDFIESATQIHQNGESQLELIISANGAKSINLNFDDFFLPDSAFLFLKSLNEKDHLGALGKWNNKLDRKFSSRPIRGNRLSIMLRIPTQKLDSASINIAQVVYGYRDVFQKASKGFDDSGSCNRNINCPEAAPWQNVKRSVVLILTSANQRACSGTLLNNVRRDSIPYLLTASHCNLQTNSIFVFNYENSSSNCQTNQDGNLSNSISGAFARAESSYSDFKLFELSSTPPPNYNAYYAGWSAENKAPQQSTCIHHPRGDIKKISQDFDSATSANFDAQYQNTHWQIGNWESGTTEQGSSGSAIFDQFKRVVGALDGGQASCTRNLYDFFGKFAVSWDHFPAPNRQLKHWLDPDNTNTLVIDGLDTKSRTFNQDIELSFVENMPTFNCDSSRQAKIYFTNIGNDTIRNVSIDYGTNFQFNQTVNWNGTIATDEIGSLQLPALILNQSDTVFNARLNLSSTDQDLSNNFYSVQVIPNPQPSKIGLTFNTDQYGNENSWEIRTAQGNTLLLSGGPYPESPDTSGTTFRDSLCLYEGCFNLTLFDAYADGFNTNFWGQGYFLLRNRFGDTLVNERNFTTAQKTISFCVSDSATFIREISAEPRVKLYPNPINRGDLLQIEKGSYRIKGIQIFDLQGRSVLSSPAVQVEIPSDLATGMYLIRFNLDDNWTKPSKLVIK